MLWISAFFASSRLCVRFYDAVFVVKERPVSRRSLTMGEYQSVHTSVYTF